MSPATPTLRLQLTFPANKVTLQPHSFLIELGLTSFLVYLTVTRQFSRGTGFQELSLTLAPKAAALQQPHLQLWRSGVGFVIFFVCGCQQTSNSPLCFPLLHICLYRGNYLQSGSSRGLERSRKSGNICLCPSFSQVSYWKSMFTNYLDSRQIEFSHN